MLVKDHIDKIKIIKSKNNIIKMYWESNYLIQVTDYYYDKQNNLIEEKIIQLNKNDNSKKIMHCKYFDEYTETITIDNSVVDLITSGNIFRYNF